MPTTYSVTTSFSANTTAIASEVNQNFTDVLTALNSFDATNLTGTIALARISDLTSTQMSSAFFKDQDDMTSNSATAVASQQSVKAYVDAAPSTAMTPTSYAAEESITFANGFIMKQGTISVSANGNSTVTFGGVGTENPFPTAIVNAFATLKDSATTRESPVSTADWLVGSMTVVNHNTTTETVSWQAWGY